VNRAVAPNGRPICFGNPLLFEGYHASYADTGEPYADTFVIVRGVACVVEVTLLERLVVQPATADR
jgi:hypothetical protein